MNQSLTLIFIHGWALDATIWNSLRAHLSDWPQCAVDAAYFADPLTGPPISFIMSINRPFVLVGHSLGFMQALHYSSLNRHCVGLIAINGFARFCQAKDFRYGINERVLNRMCIQLKHSAQQVLENFWRQLEAEPIIRRAQLETLEKGLLSLRDDDLTETLNQCQIPVLVLSSTNDPIVSREMSDYTFALLESSIVHWHGNGKHLLPISATSWCAHHIQSFLAGLVTT